MALHPENDEEWFVVQNALAEFRARKNGADKCFQLICPPESPNVDSDKGICNDVSRL